MMQDQRMDINKPTYDSITPIWIASYNNRNQVVQAILQSGRYINPETKYQNKTALEHKKTKRITKNSQYDRKLHEKPCGRKSEPVSNTREVISTKPEIKIKLISECFLCFSLSLSLSLSLPLLKRKESFLLDTILTQNNSSR